VRTLVFSPDGSPLASAGDDRTIRVWETRTGGAFNALAGHTDWVRALAFFPDSHHLVSVGDDRTVRVWDIAAAKPVMSIRIGHGLRHVTTDGSRVAVAGERGPYFLMIDD
jgi:WD40 repeat protein